jgi:hypothetical protein
VARIFRSLLFFAAAALVGATTARAENYALLIGVSGYPTLSTHQLEGPRNDVVLLRDVLARRGFRPNNIRILADGVPGAEAPTRTRIMEALDTLADRVHPNDFVRLVFRARLAAAGRSRQPEPQAGRAEFDDITDRYRQVVWPRQVGRECDHRSSVRRGAQ